MRILVSDELPALWSAWACAPTPRHATLLDLALLEEIYAHLPDRVFSGGRVDPGRHPLIGWLYQELWRWAVHCQCQRTAPLAFRGGIERRLARLLAG